MNPSALVALRRSLPAPFNVQTGFALLIGRSVFMLSNYERGKHPVPPGVAAFAAVVSALAGEVTSAALKATLDQAAESAGLAADQFKG